MIDQKWIKTDQTTFFKRMSASKRTDFPCFTRVGNHVFLFGYAARKNGDVVSEFWKFLFQVFYHAPLSSPHLSCKLTAQISTLGMEFVIKIQLTSVQISQPV